MWFETLISIFIIASCSAVPKKVPHDNIDRIINGQLVSIEDRPYMASVRMYDVHICGGSIISSDTVLTAAHCIEVTEEDEETSPYVAVGTMVNFGLATEFDIKYMVKHAGFKADEYMNDIGVLKLDGHVIFSPQIQPIAMAQQEPPVGTLAILSGWGGTETIPGIPIQRKLGSIQLLKTAEVPIVDFDACAEEYSQFLALGRGQFCAGYRAGGADACQGDSGGPLVYAGKQIGIVSFGNGCGDGGYPGVFTSVPKYYDWIRQFIQ